MFRTAATLGLLSILACVNAASAQNPTKFCNIIKDSIETSNKVAAHDMTASDFRHACSLKFDNETAFQELMSNSKGEGFIEIFDVLKGGGGGNLIDTSKVSYSLTQFRHACKILERFDFRSSFDSVRAKNINARAFDSYDKCLDMLASSLGQFGYHTPLDDDSKTFLVRISTKAVGPDNPTIISITPDAVKCYMAGKIIDKFPYETKNFVFDLECVRPKNVNLMAINTWRGNLPEMPFKNNMKAGNLTLTVEDFHQSNKINSWALLEVELFDTDGQKISVDRAEYSSCWSDCRHPTSARVEALYDGIDAYTGNEGHQRIFWAPRVGYNGPEDDVGESVTFHFNPTVVDKIRLVQWFSDGCMAKCSDEKISNGEAKIRRNARIISVSLDGGREVFPVLLPNIPDVTLSVRQ